MLCAAPNPHARTSVHRTTRAAGAAACRYYDALQKWHFLGVFCAKALQDSRLIALPLSLPMFKIMCGRTLTRSDIFEIDPDTAKWLADVHGLVARKRAIVADPLLGAAERSARLAALTLGGDSNGDGAYRVEELMLSVTWRWSFLC